MLATVREGLIYVMNAISRGILTFSLKMPYQVLGRSSYCSSTRVGKRGIENVSPMIQQWGQLLKLCLPSGLGPLVMEKVCGA